MNNQLQLVFPLFAPGMFREIRENYQQCEAAKLQAEMQHLKNRIRGYEGYKTKRCKQKKKR